MANVITWRDIRQMQMGTSVYFEHAILRYTTSHYYLVRIIDDKTVEMMTPDGKHFRMQDNRKGRYWDASPSLHEMLTTDWT